MLPDGDGFTLFREFREKRNMPIFILSARDEDNDRLFGLGLELMIISRSRFTARAAAQDWSNFEKDIFLSE